MPGMRDVARESGVALSTVSVILNEDNEKYVSEETRQRVLAAVEQLNYKMPPKKDKTVPTIAVVLPCIASSFFPSVLAGIEAAANENGYQLLYCDANSSFKKEYRMVEMLRKHTLAGIIVDSLCPKEEEEAYLALLKQLFVEPKGIPVVFLERKIKHPYFYSISADDCSNAYTAVKHLIDTGRRRIAHIVGPSSYASSERRLEGYMQALTDFQVPFVSSLVEDGNFAPLSGYVAMKKILARGVSFDGLFAANDQMAIGAIKALKESGKRIPDDIGVVGMDNISHASMINPALTTIRVPIYAMGFQAAELIARAKRGRVSADARHVSLKADLVIRRSTVSSASSEWDLMGW